MKEIIYMGSDHAGFKLKEKIKKFLIKKNYNFEDLSAHKYDKSDDYPDYAKKVCKKVLKKKSRGILICSTGQGICIAANKFKGIIAALCWDTKTAKQSREHLNANILCLPNNAKKYDKIIKIWLNTKFSNSKRHVRRLNKIKRLK